MVRVSDRSEGLLRWNRAGYVTGSDWEFLLEGACSTKGFRVTPRCIDATGRATIPSFPQLLLPGRCLPGESPSNITRMPLTIDSNALRYYPSGPGGHGHLGSPGAVEASNLWGNYIITKIERELPQKIYMGKTDTRGTKRGARIDGEWRNIE